MSSTPDGQTDTTTTRHHHQTADSRTAEQQNSRQQDRTPPDTRHHRILFGIMLYSTKQQNDRQRTSDRQQKRKRQRQRTRPLLFSWHHAFISNPAIATFFYHPILFAMPLLTTFLLSFHALFRASKIAFRFTLPMYRLFSEERNLNSFSAVLPEILNKRSGQLQMIFNAYAVRYQVTLNWHSSDTLLKTYDGSDQTFQ